MFHLRPSLIDILRHFNLVQPYVSLIQKNFSAADSPAKMQSRI